MIPLRGLVGLAKHIQTLPTNHVSLNGLNTADDDNDSLTQTLHEERRVWSQSSTESLSHPTILNQDLTYDDNLFYDADIDAVSLSNRSDLSDTSHASTTSRASHFREGSMNEASRALASTWSDHSNLSLSTVKHDENSTPRPSMDSQITRHSAYDVRDLNPSKSSSSILKKTLKRLSRTSTTLSSVDTDSVDTASFEDQGSVRAGPQGTARASRTALRRSISSMKLFTTATFNPDQSEEDTNTTEAEGLTTENRPQKMKTLKSMKSFKRVKPKKDVAHASPTQNANMSRFDTLRPRKIVPTYNSNATITQKSILDERKRKAETAYAEHFGTVKRVKNEASELAPSGVVHLTEPDSDATVKRPGWSKAALRTMKSALGKVGNNRHSVQGTAPDITMTTARPASALLDPASLVDDDYPTPKLEKRLPPIPTATAYPTHELADTSLPFLAPDTAAQKPKTTHSHSRTLSRTSNVSATSSTTNDTDLDRSKQRSYSQLEKENLQLRALLREKEAVTTVRHRAPRRSLPAQESPTIDFEQHDQQYKFQTRRRSDHNWLIYEDSPTDSTDLGATIIHIKNPNTGQDVAVLAPTNRSPTELDESRNSSASISSISTRELRNRHEAANNKKDKHIDVDKAADRGTVKRRFEVPRSLSVVLENAEKENEITNPDSDNLQQPQLSFNGRSENNPITKKPARQWVWDEDVF